MVVQELRLSHNRRVQGLSSGIHSSTSCGISGSEQKIRLEARHEDIDCMFVCLFQGCILLQGCQVNELVANPDEPGRHLFEIVPGKVPSNSSSLVLPSNLS